MRIKWIIECRDATGALDFEGRQPEEVFGHRALEGISEDQMAKEIFRHVPEAELRGDNIAHWPALLDPRWIARVKTW